MSWHVFTGDREPHDGIAALPGPPPWRDFRTEDVVRSVNEHRASAYRPNADTVDLVNAALYLRRPLLITGLPGTGKSTLAYAIARELKLGEVLYWPVTSRSTRRDGLYQYDALGRLYAANQQASDNGERGHLVDDIGRFLRLGPLGTALLPADRPRVLLIDEIDKGDLDFPNDLLTVFEQGEYEIPELSRVADVRPEVQVMTADTGARTTVAGGVVRCRSFPVVVMTSNGEREFPPAFLRRCISLRLDQPEPLKLIDIVEAHLGDLGEESSDLITRFLDRRSAGALATDQLLNAVYLIHHARPANRVALADQIFSFLSEQTDDESDDS